MNIALIPARRDSTRLKGKNLKDLCGKPLICWTLDAAIESKIFDKIIVSTDWVDLIVQLSPNYPDVEFILRPSYLHGDISIHRIIDHVLTPYMSNDFCLLQVPNVRFCYLEATTPIRSITDLIITKELFTEEYNSLFSVNKHTLKPNGSIYWFRDSKDLWKKPSYIYEMDTIHSIDVDYIWDFRVAEFYLQKQREIEEDELSRISQ